MAYEHKPGQGTIFQNDREPGSKAPIMKGQIKTPDGALYDIALWTVTDDGGQPRRDKHGKPFYSVKVTEPYQKAPAREEARPAPVQGRHGGGALDDEIPFAPEVR